jgi:hypothetical protein
VKALEQETERLAVEQEIHAVTEATDQMADSLAEQAEALKTRCARPAPGRTSSASSSDSKTRSRPSRRRRARPVSRPTRLPHRRRSPDGAPRLTPLAGSPRDAPISHDPRYDHGPRLQGRALPP